MTGEGDVIITGLLQLFGAKPMSDVTRILSQIESGDPAAAEPQLPLVYEELRKLAAQKMAQEKPDQTLQPTALVHDAYIRLVDVEQAQHWNSRGHFFGAAAEAMRRILVERARRKGRLKRGGQRRPNRGHTRPLIGKNMATQMAPLIKDAKSGRSTDLAGVSWITPVARAD